MWSNNPLEDKILWIDNPDKELESPDVKKVLKTIKITDSLTEAQLYDQLWLQENKVPLKAKEEIKWKIKWLRDWDKLKLLSNFDIAIERGWVEWTFASLWNYETKLISELINTRELIKEERKTLVEWLSIENKVRYHILFSWESEVSKLVKNANQKEIYSIFWTIRKLWLEKNENYNLIRKSFTKENNWWFEINLYWSAVLEKYLTIWDIFGDQKTIYVWEKLYTQKTDWTFRDKRWTKLKMKEWLLISFYKSDIIPNQVKSENIPKERKQKNISKWSEQKDDAKEALNLDEKMSKVLNSVAPSLWLDPEHVKSLIIRESGWKIDAKSNTGSRWIMQLTGSVFADMKLWGGWRWENYTDYFAKIPTDIINMIWDKNAKSRQAMIRIAEIAKSWEQPNKKEYNSLMNQAKKWIYDPVLNMIMWCIYLTYQKEHWAERIIKKLNTKILNSLIAGKWITSWSKETQEYLTKLKKQLKADPELQAEYNACVNYNADKTPERDWVSHMHYFWAAVMITKLARADKKKQVS